MCAPQALASSNVASSVASWRSSSRSAVVSTARCVALSWGGPTVMPDGCFVSNTRGGLSASARPRMIDNETVGMPACSMAR